jgi:hypothetical protein
MPSADGTPISRPRGRNLPRDNRRPSRWPCAWPSTRGLGLVRIQDRLSRRGVSVSLATLSYWQTGRSRPVRRASQATRRADHAARPDQWIVIMHLDEHDRALPVIRPLRQCTLGRVVARQEPPHPLATNYERKFRPPVREYVLEVFRPRRDAASTTCGRRTTPSARVR